MGQTITENKKSNTPKTKSEKHTRTRTITKNIVYGLYVCIGICLMTIPLIVGANRIDWYFFTMCVIITTLYIGYDYICDKFKDHMPEFKPNKIPHDATRAFILFDFIFIIMGLYLITQFIITIKPLFY